MLNPSVLFPLYLACSCTSIEYTNPSANCPCLTLISHHFPSHILRSSMLHFQQFFEDDTFSLVYDISLCVWCSPSIFLHLFLLSPHTLWLISFISSDLSSNVISSERHPWSRKQHLSTLYLPCSTFCLFVALLIHKLTYTFLFIFPLSIFSTGL